MGSRKPNDLGLFDMHGNIITWCQERRRNNRDPKDNQVMEDTEDGLTVASTDGRLVRGGTFYSHALDIRSADIGGYGSTYHGYEVGVRPARTLKP